MQATPHNPRRRAPSVPDDVVAGLLAPRKHLPARLLYDEVGAALFEEICTLEEYYLTRSELALLVAHLPAIAEAVGPAARVIEPGSGAGEKTRMLLSALKLATTYIPIDVSKTQLLDNAALLRAEFPDIRVHPVCGDYHQTLQIPPPSPESHSLVFFPGSTIGNFEPQDAQEFLARFRELAGTGGMLLLGADSNQNVAELLAAYDDAKGVTAAFNLNVLAHINRTHRADFDLSTFRHRTTWDPARCRIEMHLVSEIHQQVDVDGHSLTFERGEPIVTEHCYKHAPEAIRRMLQSAGWRLREVYVDGAGRMRLWLADQA